MTLSGYTIRCQVQTQDFSRPFTAVNGSTPKIPAGVDLRMDFLCKFGSEVVDVANFVTVTLSVLAASRTGAPYMTASTGTFDTTADQDSFDDGTKQHFYFEFPAAETDLAATIGGTEYYLVLQAKGAGDVILFEAWTRFVAILDGLPEDQLVVQPGNVVPGGATYSAGGAYDLSALTTDGVFYKWTDGGANDTDVDNGGDVITTSGTNFIAASSVVLHGTALAAVTAVVRKSPYLTADEVQALLDAITGGTNSGGTVDPNGVQTAPQWSIYTQLDGGGDMIRTWTKTSAGVGNTGWI